MPAELVVVRGGFLVIDYITGRSTGTLSPERCAAHLETALDYVNGFPVEFQSHDGTWMLCEGVPAFWADRKYRAIKPVSFEPLQ